MLTLPPGKLKADSGELSRFDNMQDRPHMNVLREYMLGKTKTSQAIHNVLEDSKNRIGVVFSERLVNMPVQVIPPLTRIFEGDLTTAVSTVY